MNFIDLEPPISQNDLSYFNKYYDCLEKGFNVNVPGWDISRFNSLGGVFSWGTFSYGISNIPDCKESRSSITACILTYQCEKWIEHCIIAARKFADKIIIVDQGSIDATLKLAAKLADIVINVPGCDDFGLKRNIGIENVDTEWVWMIDSDEVLPKNGEVDLRKVITWADKTGIDVVWFARFWLKENEIAPLKYYKGHYFLWPDPQARLVRMSIKPRYKESIHEYLEVQNGKYGCLVANHNCSLLHLKYWLTSTKERERVLSVRKSRVQNGPDDIQFFPGKKGYPVCNLSTIELYPETLTFIKKITTQ